jgi:hypothetical protein
MEEEKTLSEELEKPKNKPFSQIVVRMLIINP